MANRKSREIGTGALLCLLETLSLSYPIYSKIRRLKRIAIAYMKIAQVQRSTASGELYISLAPRLGTIALGRTEAIYVGYCDAAV